MKAFISYSTLDKLPAGKISDHLSMYGIDSFMAHEDVQMSEEWKRRIQLELAAASILITLLSKNFRASDWTSQEIGLFISNPSRLVIPLSLDGTTPYGFIDHIQGKKAKPDRDMHEEYVINPILRHYTAEMTSILVDKLVVSRGFRWSEHLMLLLQPYYSSLSNGDVLKLMAGAVANDQIHSAGDCRTKYLPEFISSNMARVPAGDITRLQTILDKDLSFTQKIVLPISASTLR